MSHPQSYGELIQTHYISLSVHSGPLRTMIAFIHIVKYNYTLNAKTISEYDDRRRDEIVCNNAIAH